MAIDYTIFYKSSLPVTDEEWTDSWDIFISGFSNCDRVNTVYKKAKANNKIWLVSPEYKIPRKSFPSQDYFYEDTRDEAEYFLSFWKKHNNLFHKKNICIDITGIIRPHLIFLINFLYSKGIKKFDTIYSEPLKYTDGAETEFSCKTVETVRQIRGCEGPHTRNTDSDLLIIGSGYENHLISQVAEDKSKASKVQIFGFPSLRADMYQENILRVNQAAESLGEFSDDNCTHFAPANDPFVLANKLSEIVSNWREKNKDSNIYLCPLATKAHVLGFSIFYIRECKDLPISITSPIQATYKSSTCENVTRIWKYTIDFSDC